jgi:hypothetical protein
MAREIPEVVRAAAGLAATVLDEARKLPETLPGLPVRLIGQALQRAMRIQQHYAGLVARGDEVFTGIRGDNEPGLATFDDDDDDADAPAAPSGGFRESAFDRVDDFPLDSGQDELLEAELIEAELAAAELADDPAVEAIVDEVERAAVVVEDARETVEVLAEEAPGTDALLEEVLDEIAIDDLVADAPQTTIPVEAALPGTAATKKATPEKPAAEEPAATKAAGNGTPAKKAAKKAAAAAALEPEPAPTLAPRGLTPPPAAAPAAEAPATEPSPAVTETSLAAPATAPIDGYDFFSVAQLRAYLRGYAASTVEELLAYEKAGLAREPYLRLLRNRLERLRSESA